MIESSKNTCHVKKHFFLIASKSSRSFSVPFQSCLLFKRLAQATCEQNSDFDVIRTWKANKSEGIPPLTRFRLEINPISISSLYQQRNAWQKLLSDHTLVWNEDCGAMASHNTAVWAKLEDSSLSFLHQISSLMTQRLVKWLITSRYHWYQYGMWLTNVDQSSPTRRSVEDCRPCDLWPCPPTLARVGGHFFKGHSFAEEISFWFFPSTPPLIWFVGSFEPQFHQEIPWFLSVDLNFNTMCEETTGKDIAKSLRFYTDFSLAWAACEAGTRGGWNHHESFVWSWWSGVFWLQPSDFLCRRTLA